MKLGVTPQLQTSAVNLEMDRDRVVGVEVERAGTRELHRARLGVVLATGGFEWNTTMVRNFLGIPELTPASPPTSIGLGVGLAILAGAALGNMTNAWWDVACTSRAKTMTTSRTTRPPRPGEAAPGTMMVDRHGRRFVNESMNYSDMGVIMKTFDPLAYEYPNMPSHIVFDGAAGQLQDREPGSGHSRSGLAYTGRHH